MNQEYFKGQVERLKERFGEKNFDTQFVHLVWAECRDMSEPAFKRACDVFIGSRSPNKPPLLSEFREARLNEEKIAFANDLRGASQTLGRKAPEEMRENMLQVLSKEFGGVDGVKDAFEIARHRQRIKSSDDDGPGAA